MIYADYASIYDAIGQGDFAAGLANRILAALPAPPQRALDLACGTGAATLVLAATGAETVGLDRSPQMLAIAQGRARDQQLPIGFVEADLRHLPIASANNAEVASNLPFAAGLLLPTSFDLITCLYDSLNYLLGDDDLASVCAGAAQLLRPGGRLFFDLNTEYEFGSWHEGDQVVHDADGVFVYNQLRYDPATGLAQGRIVWLVRKGERWRRGEETHTERAWSNPELLAALDGAGLRLVARRTPAWQPAPPNAPRIVYEAVKQ